MILSVPVVLGLAKAGYGFENHRPIGWLVLSLLGTVVLGLWAFLRPLRYTGRGEGTLARLKKLHPVQSEEPAISDPALTWAIALFGLQTLSTGSSAPLKSALHPEPLVLAAGSGGGGCGGGCGGGDGGGGGGCGGCGGCGG
jgi:hypothetical protein